MSNTGKRSLVNLIIVGILILATMLITALSASAQEPASDPANVTVIPTSKVALVATSLELSDFSQQAIKIGFDDLKAGTSVGDLFLSKGVLFDNAVVFAGPFPVSLPNDIQSSNSSPITIRFPKGVVRVGISIDTDGYDLNRQPQMRLFDMDGNLLRIENFGQGPDFVGFEFPGILISKIQLGSTPYGNPNGPFGYSDAYDNLIFDIRYAQTLTPEVVTAPVIASTSEEFKMLREKFETALTRFREAEDKLKVAEAKFEPMAEQFESEKEAFKSIAESLTKEERQAKKAELQNKGEGIKRQKQELQKVVKEFLGKRIDLLIADIELIKYDAKFAGNGEALPFDASATLDKHIMELEQIRTRVQQVSNKQDMKGINRDLKDIKEKFELEKRYFKGIRVNNNMEIFFERAGNAPARMDDVIKKLNDNGKDTSKLTAAASNFNNLLNNAKEAHKKTLGLYKDHSGFDSAGMVTDIRNAQDFMRQIRELQKDTMRLKSGISDLREFFRETKRLIGETEKPATTTGGTGT